MESTNTNMSVAFESSTTKLVHKLWVTNNKTKDANKLVMDQKGRNENIKRFVGKVPK